MQSVILTTVILSSCWSAFCYRSTRRKRETRDGLG